MKKLLAFIIIVSLSQFTFAQVGIGTDTPHQSTIFDVVAENKGIMMPNIALENRTDNTTIENPADGLLVYNTTTLFGNENTRLDPGYYYWLTDRWVPQQKGEIVDVTTNGELRTFLGYNPDGTRTSNNFTHAGITFTGLGCKQWTVNGHYYCAFRGNTGFNWETAFGAAKSLGGYLVTFTTLAEWNWVKTELINNGTGYNMPNSIWLGYNKVNFSGNPTEFTWITGEKSRVNWGTDNTTEHYFDGPEPNNANGNEGCVHVLHRSLNTDRRWNDIACSSSTSGWSSPWSDLIVEFHQ